MLSEQFIRSPADQRARAAELKAKFFPRVPPVIVDKRPKWRTIYVNRPRFEIDLFAPRCAWPRVIKALQPGDLVPFKQVVAAVCEVFGVTKEDLVGPRRTRDIVLPRHVAMYFASEMSRLSLPEVGRRFGGRDHTSVLFAVRKVAALVSDGREEILDATARIQKLIYGERHEAP